jgi:4-amino-4-deoxy-L-arabinose transferase-like glycosyltransferase
MLWRRRSQPLARRSFLKLVLGQAKTGREHFPIASILVLSFVLNITGITWGLPNHLDWAVDTIVPFDMLEAAYKRFSGGWANIYPPLPYLIQAALSAPLLGYLMLIGGLKAPNPTFPFGLADPLSTMTSIILIARIWSVLLATGIVLLVYLTVQELFDRRSAIFSALVVTLYYPLVYYAHNANVDVPYLFWSALAIYWFLQVLKQGRLKDYVLFAFFGILAICTKDQAYGLFLLSPLPILWTRLMEAGRQPDKQLSWRPLLWDRRLLAAGVVAIVTFVLGQNLLFNFSGFINHIQIIVGPGSALYAAYAPTLSGQLQLFWATIWELAVGMTLPLFLLCLIGCIYCTVKFPRHSLPLLFLAMSYYLTLISVVRYVPLRFVLPIGIIMAFFGGKVISDIWQQGRWQTLRRVAVCLAFGYAALVVIQLDVLLINDPRYAAEQWLRENIREGAVIETFAPNESFLKHYPRFPLSVKVRSSRLSAGTQWEVPEKAPEKKIFPNSYAGREDPDYVILSKHWYGRFLAAEAGDTPQARVLNDLFRSRTEYALVATFETPTFVPANGLPINPRIDIFAKSKEMHNTTHALSENTTFGRDGRQKSSQIGDVVGGKR